MAASINPSIFGRQKERCGELPIKLVSGFVSTPSQFLSSAKLGALECKVKKKQVCVHIQILSSYIFSALWGNLTRSFIYQKAQFRSS